MSPYRDEHDHLRTFYVMRDLHERDVFHVYLYVSRTSEVYGPGTVKWLLFSLPDDCLAELISDEQQTERLKKLDYGESVACQIDFNLEI